MGLCDAKHISLPRIFLRIRSVNVQSSSIIPSISFMFNVECFIFINLDNEGSFNFYCQIFQIVLMLLPNKLDLVHAYLQV